MFKLYAMLLGILIPAAAMIATVAAIIFTERRRHE